MMSFTAQRVTACELLPRIPAAPRVDTERDDEGHVDERYECGLDVVCEESDAERPREDDEHPRDLLRTGVQTDRKADPEDDKRKPLEPECGGGVTWRNGWLLY